MSHLLKSKKSFLNILRFIIFFYFNYNNYSDFFYDGNKLIIFIYAVLFNLIFYFVLSKKLISLKFFGGLLWLGFWYKLFIIIVFDSYQFREGPGIYQQFDFNTKIQTIDNSLVLTCYAISGFLFACLIKKFFKKNFFL